MKKRPKKITVAKLEVLIFPSGEIISAGRTIGTFKYYKKYLSDPEDAMTGKPLK